MNIINSNASSNASINTSRNPYNYKYELSINITLKNIFVSSDTKMKALIESSKPVKSKSIPKKIITAKFNNAYCIDLSTHYDFKDLLSFQFIGKKISTKLSVGLERRLDIFSTTVDKFKCKL
jgi:hypothetical protein